MDAIDAVFGALISVLGFWVGTAVDPLFWVIAIAVGMATLTRPWIRIVAAVAFGFVRCLVLPGWLYGGIRPDGLLITLAVAFEFWAVAWLAAHAILWLKAKRAHREARPLGSGESRGD